MKKIFKSNFNQNIIIDDNAKNIFTIPNKENISLYRSIQNLLIDACKELSINYSSQFYLISTFKESLEHSMTYDIGFEKMLSFYGKFYIDPPKIDSFIINEKIENVYPEKNDIILIAGKVQNNITIETKTNYIEFYIGSAGFLKNFEVNSWLPI